MHDGAYSSARRVCTLNRSSFDMLGEMFHWLAAKPYE